LDRAEKFQNIAQTIGSVDFLIRVQVIRGQLRGDLLHVQIFRNDGPKPKFWITIWNIITHYQVYPRHFA
jgi:hypothetical protein